jgi:hypothetical protein
MSGIFTKVHAGGTNTCAVSATGSVECWGINLFGEGDPPADGTFTQVSASRMDGYHTCAVSTDGFVECWGNPTTTTFVEGNTLPGTEVPVEPVDETTGEPSPVSLTFDEVTGGGETTVSSAEVGQGGGELPPKQFRLGSPPTYFNIETTATFNGTIEVCLNYVEAGISFGNEERLELLHYEGSAWVKRTSFLDTTNDIICATVGSLSPFLAAEENVAPVVGSISLPGQPTSLGATTSITASFSDENPYDLHAATIDWGDGQVTSGEVTEPSDGSGGSVLGTHTYATPGVFTVILTVTETMEPGYDLSGHGSSEDEVVNPYVVVFDPEGGFVTGGGWFISPEGAYIGTPLNGRANFGFVSRYKKGATVPTGNTEFQFKAGDLNFRSDRYDWLVVTGSDYARFKGAGTINGMTCDAANPYRFQLWAGDGDPDTFRIKIWCEDETTAEETVIYDNGFDQPVGGGSIVIHTR